MSTEAHDAPFDPDERERQLRAESTSWDTSIVVDSDSGDIPVIDLSEAFGSPATRAAVAAELNEASENVGFFQLVGHGIDHGLIESTFEIVRRFHDLPLETNRLIAMDQPDWPLAGVGYLPMRARKLPTRDRGNLNEAFLIKGSQDIQRGDNRWLSDQLLPGFRAATEAYATAVEELALALVPLYAAALGLDEAYFGEAFEHPSWRLRMTHYPPDGGVRAKSDGADDSEHEAADFGIAPHVDTTFFTLLLQDGPGLVVFSNLRNEWISVPVVDGAFVVNAGELLKQWTNDRYLSARHFANNGANDARYSIPFFFNAAADYPMACLPTCHDEANPPKYPTISYNQSQAIAQGE